MKVLFAVSNEEISESIVKRYQKDYKQIISYKNVYYFNAILKEIQKDKSYDRIVISEELEAFTHTQYEQIDKFIFEKLDGISDEASNTRGNDIPIILICSDRRVKSEEMLVKLFGIGIYNAVLGSDRSVEEVCKLINRPRSKKEAKTYYQIDSENVSYQSENENDVSEIEIQNILAHYKRLGKNEDKYLESFDNIASQYNDTQLRIISKFLPLNVRAVLEERSPKYQQIMSFNSSVSDSIRKTKNEEADGPSEKLLKSAKKEVVMSKPVVIPSSVDMTGGKKLSRPKRQTQVQMPVPGNDEEEQSYNVKPSAFEEVETTQPQQEAVSELVEEKPVKRGRGRPRKNPIPDETTATTVKRGRGRPRKNPIPVVPEPEQEPEQEETAVLPGLNTMTTQEPEETILPGISDEPTSYSKPTQVNNNAFINNNTSNIFSNSDYDEEDTYDEPDNYSIIRETPRIDRTVQTERVDLSQLLTQDKKIVTFVGTGKNGTSFIVNNLAELLSSSGINVAILDTTQNRNSYYIYTKNEEQLRDIATHSIQDLTKGVANGISVNRNLTVYTSLPDDSEDILHADRILETLLKNHSLILIDTDFNTPFRYFEQSQETYLIQTLDVLTIQPLTAFLRELKAKNVLDEKKLRIVLNKSVKIKGITDKTIIGGMAFYNDPSMSFMTELFDRNLIRYVSIPFEEETYIKYLENVIECNISLKGYSKGFMQTLRELGNMVYQVNNMGYRPPTAKGYSNGNTFSPNINSTLNQMKNNY